MSEKIRKIESENGWTYPDFVKKQLAEYGWVTEDVEEELFAEYNDAEYNERNA